MFPRARVSIKVPIYRLVEKVKGQGHRTPKTLRNFRTYGVHVYLLAADEAPAAQAPTANKAWPIVKPVSA